MEEQNLDDLLGGKKEQPADQYRKTGKKYIYTKKHLSAFSVFMRVLLIIIWWVALSGDLFSPHKSYLIFIAALIYGLVISIFWFSLGNIYSTKEIEYEEYEKCEDINN